MSELHGLDRRLDEAALNAWPAPQQLLIDGWVARFGGGYTKRANSTTPLYPAQRPPDETLATCEQLYRARGLPPIVRLVSFGGHAPLDALLAARGYTLLDPSLVLRRDLAPEPAGEDESAALEQLDLDPWLALYAALSGVAPETLPAHRAILAGITAERGMFGLRAGGELVACGMAVREVPFVGLFDIVVGRGHRRRGYGQALVRGMLGWGAGRGARHAYLQVVEANAPARRLYEGLGFREAYRYWYRALGA
jgi:N-acetylglutamate synthase